MRRRGERGSLYVEYAIAAALLLAVFALLGAPMQNLIINRAVRSIQSVNGTNGMAPCAASPGPGAPERWLNRNDLECL